MSEDFTQNSKMRQFYPLLRIRVHMDPHHFANPDPHQFAYDKPKCMEKEPIEHFFKVLSLYLEARVKSRIRIK